MRDYDFSGWATRNDLKCADGRTIRRNAFIDNDGMTVPLVWSHQHKSPDNVLGHCVLKNMEDGVYAYGYFNDTPNAKHAKEAVMHKDITSLSIFANQLRQNGGDVIHGSIKEVSLVLAGANPGAYIDNPVVVHSDGESYDNEYEAYISPMMPLELAHAEPEEQPAQKTEDKTDEKAASGDDRTIEDVINTFTDEEAKMLLFTCKIVCGEKPDGDPKAMMNIYNGLPKDKKAAADFVVAALAKEKGFDPKKLGGAKETKAEETAEHSFNGGYEDMSYSVFEGDAMQQDRQTLSHDQLTTILKEGKKYGSLRDSFLAHAQEYGIENIDYLFPDARTVTDKPEFIKRETDWVQKVMGATHHTPFSRIKSVFANITEDEARARGYIKGKMKKEEVFPLLRRTTEPTTIYKKQKLDRDDIIDITDFDVVAWIKSEMRLMLDEEIARAILFGDGRSAIDEDKIAEDKIRPVVSDADLFTIKKTVTGTAADMAATFVDDVIIAMDDFKGTGEPTAYMRQDLFTRLMLLKDTQGYRLYKSKSELETALMVKEIVKIPNDIAGNHYCTIVNLADYNVGADKGGSINMFEDFDIDYNQEKYLIETRCSGAMVKPYAAIAFTKAS